MILKRPQLPKMKFIIALVTVVACLAGATAAAHAQGFRSGDHTRVERGETVDSSLFITGQTIDIDGTVNGDVFCAGQNITISGHVTGDVICAGQIVQINGTVDGDIRVAGQNVTVGAKVGHNLSLAGQSVTVSQAAEIEGDASVAGQQADIDGNIGRDLAAASAVANLNGKVGRNLQATGSDLTLGSKARVSGNLTYTSRSDLKQENGAVVTGETDHRQPKQGESDRGMSVVFATLAALSILVLSMALVLLMPQVFQRFTSDAILFPGRTFLVGVIVSFLAPIVIAALFLTAVGIPLALLAILVWIVICALTFPVAAYLLGRSLLRNSTPNSLWYMLLGVVLLIVLLIVPILNFLALLAAFWFGLGTIALQCRSLPSIQYRQIEAMPTISPKHTKRSDDEDDDEDRA